jgi:hypothetical protein
VTLMTRFTHGAGTDHSSGTEGVWSTPVLIKNGLLAGLGLITAKIPELFPPQFFDIERLDKVYTAGLAEYKEMTVRYHHSGNHGGKPWWHFVGPVCTTVQEDQHLHLLVPSKRWDSLAFFMMHQQVQSLNGIFCRVIPGGKGGPAAAAVPLAGQLGGCF